MMQVARFGNARSIVITDEDTGQRLVGAQLPQVLEYDRDYGFVVHLTANSIDITMDNQEVLRFQAQDRQLVPQAVSLGFECATSGYAIDNVIIETARPSSEY